MGTRITLLRPLVESPAASLTVVIPLYNEADGIPALADRMRSFVAAEAEHREVDLVLVDDGSTDATHELLSRHCADLPATILRHPHNRGITAALTTGSDAARGELVAWLDSDLTYDPDILTTLASTVDSGADVGIASCYHPDGVVEGVPRWRLGLSSVASLGYRRLLRNPIHTFTCMVRVYRRDVLAACRPTHDGFLGVTEVLVIALQNGYRVEEVPATLRRRRIGQSKMRIASVGTSHLGLWWRLLWRRKPS